MTDRAELERRLIDAATIYPAVPSWDAQLQVIWRERFYNAALALADAIREEQEKQDD